MQIICDIVQLWKATSLTLYEISASPLSYKGIATVFRYFKYLTQGLLMMLDKWGERGEST